MKRISTLMATLCLLAITQCVFAQSITMYTSNPNPTPTFKSPLAVDPSFGFQSTNTNIFQDFPKGQTTAITSPAYYYNTNQSTIYFKYSFTLANDMTVPGTISIIYGFPQQTISITPTINFVKGTNDIYFAFTPGSLLPANTDFQIKLELNLSMNDKAVTANSLTTNALQSANATLPVKFSSFDVKAVAEGAALAWSVGQEESVKGYEVEKSIDQKNFTTIGYVSATTLSFYTFKDPYQSTLAFYRIKAVDVDGKSAYSTVISLKSGQSSVVLRAFPTPVRKNLTVQHNAATVSTRISISSIDGRLIQSIMPVAGSQQTTVDLSAARAGLYILRFESGTGAVETLKVMKQ